MAPTHTVPVHETTAFAIDPFYPFDGLSRTFSTFMDPSYDLSTSLRANCAPLAVFVLTFALVFSVVMILLVSRRHQRDSAAAWEELLRGRRMARPSPRSSIYQSRSIRNISDTELATVASDSKKHPIAWHGSNILNTSWAWML